LLTGDGKICTFFDAGYRPMKRQAGSRQPTPQRRNMRAHCIQHVPFETPGCIEPWLRKAGFEITNTRVFQATRFPDPGNLDILIVMGGPMSVNDGSTVPWLADEKQFIRKSISKGVSVHGVLTYLVNSRMHHSCGQRTGAKH
jgi:hypothetical protein